MLKTDKLTPSVKRLLIEFMAKRQTDRCGADVGSIAADIVNGGLATTSKLAFDDLNAALDAVRHAAPPNPFKDSTDEEIASSILERLRERRGPQGAQR